MNSNPISAHSISIHELVRDRNPTRDCSLRKLMRLYPEEGADSMDTLKLNLEAAARHNTMIAPPAGFVIELDAIHVEAFADLLDLALTSRQAFVEGYYEFHRKENLSLKRNKTKI